MVGNPIIFWVYLILATIYPIVRFVIYFCVGPEESVCDWGFLRGIHFDLSTQPQFFLSYFAILLTGFAFIRGRNTIIYLGFIASNILALVFLDVPFPW